MGSEGYEQVVKKDGRAYISIDTMLDILNTMVAVRDQYVETYPGAKVLVPGSDHATHFLGKILEDIRYKFFEQDDLTGETRQMLEEIHGFLDG